MDSLWLYEILMIVATEDKAIADQISAEIQGSTVAEIGETLTQQLPKIQYDGFNPVLPIPEPAWFYCNSLMTEQMRLDCLAKMAQNELFAYFYRFLNPYLAPAQKIAVLDSYGISSEFLGDGDRILLSSNVPGSTLKLGDLIALDDAIAEFLAVMNNG